jgi:gliding motility-associated-like protein
MRRLLLLAIIHSLFILNVFATHNRAGEITYSQVSGLTYDFTITTYTKASSVDADRSELVIFWGDGSSNTLPRTAEAYLANDIKLNRYTGRHTYSGPFNYVVYVIDPNRIESILNISNSVNVPFYIEDTLKILDPTIYGFNSSPILFNPPIDFGNVNEVFVHNPNAFDPDGDSLSYTLIPPKQGVGMQVPGYVSPTVINPGPDNVLTLDVYTGELRWITPKKQGIYNVAILITEFRNGLVIGTVVRDLQIIIQAADNQPPVIEGKQQICIVAGDTINEIYIARDPNVLNKILMTSNGAPYEVDQSKANFQVTQAGNPAYSKFYWATNCDHLRNTDYQVVIKAEDDATIPLVDLKTVVIKVLAPAPKNVIGNYNPTTNEVKITWDENYPCKDSEKFQGYSVWRKVGCGFKVDTCNTDLAAAGYTKIGETKGNEWIDNNLKRGVNYSYLVVAELASKSSIGLLYNKFRGLPSEEICIELPKNIPLFYQVDVKSTDVSNGNIYIEWSKPQAIALDTIKNPGPYVIKLFRSINGTNPYQNIFETTALKYSSIWDTNFVDVGLNTLENSYQYKLEFYVAGDELLGESLVASSIFLSIIPSNQTLELNWTANVPWINEWYKIYKENTLGNFVLIDSTTSMQFLDNPLSNDSTYCYKIEGVGSYQIIGFKEPLLNFSQIICAQPKDTVPPCAPILRVENFCSSDQYEKGVYKNYLKWNFPRNCEDSAATMFYIYYKENPSSEYSLIDSAVGENSRIYTHELNESLSGCYQITAIDIDNNESALSNEICLSDCPIYKLPNVFTPNGDGINDLYTPIIPYSGVSRIAMKIFNRMGNLIFETTSPDINWDGKDQKSSKELPTAVFYYVCEVYYNTINGEMKLEKPLSGYIHLIREKK